MARQHGDFGFPGKLTFNVKVSLARLAPQAQQHLVSLWSAIDLANMSAFAYSAIWQGLGLAALCLSVPSRKAGWK